MTASIPGIEASRQASRPAGRHREQQAGIEASRQASRPAGRHRGQQAGIEAHLTKKENNKKLKRLDLDPTPPAQQSWRNLPPSSWGHEKERKQEGNPPANWREV